MELGVMLRSLKFEDVMAEINKYWKDQDEDGFRAVWNKLLTMQPQSSNLVCEVYPIRDNICLVYGVSGRDSKTNEIFAIEFVPWAEWLSMPLLAVECDLTNEQLMAQALYEMTWFGFEEEQIQKQKEEIVGEVEEIKEQLGIEDENKVIH